MLTYKNYIAAIELDTEAGFFHGRVLGIKDLITFEGETPKEVEREFRKSIDAYLSFCGSNKRQPNSPDSHEGKKIPLAVQRLIDHLDFLDKFVAAVEPFLKHRDPVAIMRFLNSIEDLSSALESIKPYLNDEPDAIIQVVERLNTLLIDPDASFVNRRIPSEEISSSTNKKTISIEGYTSQTSSEA
ncbi:hypothetical protein H6G89_29085 [Oscillatoria sp. FACHB-1407]|uniref:hypothetical protein n=1 Tax=Oscillatoria sp. FACHB-1407 TaxID=2692847 RepID=UPI001685EFE3|nr:hypothetical protein [Oscillatoria sp. FACHB-1407]MBD2465066.1 hypothetical protein [Oscillatoria sp. FACHB-1407]